MNFKEFFNKGFLKDIQKRIFVQRIFKGNILVQLKFQKKKITFFCCAPAP